jgi:hypothetical protein
VAFEAQDSQYFTHPRVAHRRPEGIDSSRSRRNESIDLEVGCLGALYAQARRSTTSDHWRIAAVHAPRPGGGRTARPSRDLERAYRSPRTRRPHDGRDRRVQPTDFRVHHRPDYPTSRSTGRSNWCWLSRCDPAPRVARLTVRPGISSAASGRRRYTGFDSFSWEFNPEPAA